MSTLSRFSFCLDMRQPNRYLARSYHASCRCPELDHRLPNIPLFALAVPLEFLKALRKLEDQRNPTINPPPMSLVVFAVLADECCLPARKSPLRRSRIGGKLVESRFQ